MSFTGTPANHDLIDQWFSYLSTLAPITEEDGRALRPSITLRELPKGACYIRPGERGEMLAFVQRGLFRFFYSDEHGRDYTSWFAGENSFIPTFTMLALGRPSRFSIEALEPSILLEFPFKALEELETRSPGAREITRRYMLSALAGKELREASLILDDAETRYLSFLRDFPNLEGRLKLHHIASYLGMSPVSLSRIRKKLGKN